MGLETSNGNSLALHIEGYQFGRSADRFDSNWLVVSGNVQLPPLQWRFRDPCLLTFEVRELAAWLRHAANPMAQAKPLNFTEPNLRFAVVGRSEDTVQVRVWFDLDCRPEEMRSVEFKEFFGDFDLHVQDLLRAADELTSGLSHHPERWRHSASGPHRTPLVQSDIERPSASGNRHYALGRVSVTRQGIPRSTTGVC